MAKIVGWAELARSMNGEWSWNGKEAGILTPDLNISLTVGDVLRKLNFAGRTSGPS